MEDQAISDGFSNLKNGKTYSVVYKILDDNGEEHTTSETFATQRKAEERKKKIEYKQSIEKLEVPQCSTVKELIEEYVQIYGHDKWGLLTPVILL